MGRPPSAPFALLLLFTLAPTLAYRLHSRLWASHISTVEYRQPAGSDFGAAIMTLLTTRLSHSYCCDLACSCADVNNTSIEPCSAIEYRLATLSPSLCANSASNSSTSPLCALLGRSTLCNGGAGCCTDTCNALCTSEPDLLCACPCELCSSTKCACCKRMEQRRCWLRMCEPCKRVWMRLDFQDNVGKPHSVNISTSFTLNSTAEAQSFYDFYKGKSSIKGYFRLDDPNIVYVPHIKTLPFLDAREEYPVPRHWAEFFGTAAAFPIFSIVILLTGLLFALLLQRRRRRTADQRPFRIAWSVNRGLWIGIAWPLIVLLLILRLGSIMTAPSIVSHQILICVDWLPLLLMWLYHIMHPHQ